MRLLASLTLLPVLIVAIILVAMFVPAPGPFPAAGTVARSRLVIVIAVPCFLAYLAIVATQIYSSFDGPGRALDLGLAPFGLAGRHVGVFGRRYEGDVRGYRVTADFQPAAGIKPHLLSMHLASNLSRRAAVGRERPLLDCRECMEVGFDDPELAGLRIYADDAGWIRSVLGERSARTAAGNLITNDEWTAAAELYFQPDRLWLRAHPRADAGSRAGWLADLLIIAAAAEGAATPGLPR